MEQTAKSRFRSSHGLVRGELRERQPQSSGASERGWEHQCAGNDCGAWTKG